jgi:hypothetical protein
MVRPRRDLPLCVGSGEPEDPALTLVPAYSRRMKGIHPSAHGGKRRCHVEIRGAWVREWACLLKKAHRCLPGVPGACLGARFAQVQGKLVTLERLATLATGVFQ